MYNTIKNCNDLSKVRSKKKKAVIPMFFHAGMSCFMFKCQLKKKKSKPALGPAGVEKSMYFDDKH